MRFQQWVEASTLTLTGQQFGRLTAISPVPFTDQHGTKTYLWKCLCECGNICLKLGYNLKSGKIKSCGCLRENPAPLSPEKLATLAANAQRSAIAEYKRSASRRDIKWALSNENCARLMQQNCYYCGACPRLKYNNKRTDFSCNGIDRVDSALGYTVENCVSCCSVCNYSKRQRSISEFTEWIKRAYEHLHLNQPPKSNVQK